MMIIPGAGLLGLFAATVWPTRWRDRLVTVGATSFTAREDRFTGAVRVLCADGWHALTIDPFADLAYPTPPAAERSDPCRSAPMVTGSRSPASR
jgi:predicted NAD/FAD-dependent oxidoreductase